MNELPCPISVSHKQSTHSMNHLCKQTKNGYNLIMVYISRNFNGASVCDYKQDTHLNNATLTQPTPHNPNCFAQYFSRCVYT